MSEEIFFELPYYLISYYLSHPETNNQDPQSYQKLQNWINDKLITYTTISWETSYVDQFEIIIYVEDNDIILPSVDEDMIVKFDLLPLNNNSIVKELEQELIKHGFVINRKMKD